VITRWQKDMHNKGWNALYLENHDNPRSISVFGDESIQCGKALALTLMTLEGTPFIYQGEEIGMTNFPFSSIDQVDATDSHHQYNELIADGFDKDTALRITTHWTRDHSRTPMQWSREGGFSGGKPWMPVNENTATRNVESELIDKDSLLNFYKELIKYRKNSDILIHGDYVLELKNAKDIWCFTRNFEGKTLLILTNLSEKEQIIDLPNRLINKQSNFVLGNVQARILQKRMKLQPFEAEIFELT
jgi:alpha-glucosidase